MAYIHFTDNTIKYVSPATGASIWRVLNGETQPTEAQRHYMRRIRRIYLNPQQAPQSYLDKYGVVIDSLKR